MIEFHITEEMMNCFFSCVEKKDYKHFFDNYSNFILELEIALKGIYLRDDQCNSRFMAQNLHEFFCFLKHINSCNPFSHSDCTNDPSFKVYEDIKNAVSQMNWSLFYQKYRHVADVIIAEGRKQKVVDICIEFNGRCYPTFWYRDSAQNHNSLQWKSLPVNIATRGDPRNSQNSNEMLKTVPQNYPRVASGTSISHRTSHNDSGNQNYNSTSKSLSPWQLETGYSSNHRNYSSIQNEQPKKEEFPLLDTPRQAKPNMSLISEFGSPSHPVSQHRSRQSVYSVPVRSESSSGNHDYGTDYGRNEHGISNYPIEKNHESFESPRIDHLNHFNTQSLYSEKKNFESPPREEQGRLVHTPYGSSSGPVQANTVGGTLNSSGLPSQNGSYVVPVDSRDGTINRNSGFSENNKRNQLNGNSTITQGILEDSIAHLDRINQQNAASLNRDSESSRIIHRANSTSQSGFAKRPATTSSSYYGTMRTTIAPHSSTMVNPLESPAFREPTQDTISLNASEYSLLNEKNPSLSGTTIMEEETLKNEDQEYNEHQPRNDIELISPSADPELDEDMISLADSCFNLDDLQNKDPIPESEEVNYDNEFYQYSADMSMVNYQTAEMIKKENEKLQKLENEKNKTIQKIVLEEDDNSSFDMKLQEMMEKQKEELRQKREERKRRQKELDKELEDLKRESKERFMMFMKCIILRQRFEEQEYRWKEWIQDSRSKIATLFKYFYIFAEDSNYRKSKNIGIDELDDFQREKSRFSANVMKTLSALNDDFDTLKGIEKYYQDAMFLRVLQKCLVNVAHILLDIYGVTENLDRDSFGKLDDEMSKIKVDLIYSTGKLKEICKIGGGEVGNVEFPVLKTDYNFEEVY